MSDLAVHEFTERTDDASMCVCGIPALMHDLIVHLAAVSHPEPQHADTQESRPEHG